MALKIIQEEPEAKKGSRFITVYRPIAGWKAVMYWWNDESPDTGPFWEPWDTSPSAFDTREEAYEDAKAWADEESCPLLELSQPKWNQHFDGALAPPSLRAYDVAELKLSNGSTINGYAHSISWVGCVMWRKLA